MDRRLSKLVLFSAVVLGCGFGSRPILPGTSDSLDAGGFGPSDAANIGNADTGAPAFGDAGGGRGNDAGASDASPPDNNFVYCAPAESSGVADGGDAGFVFRDGGAPCDPERDNPRDAAVDGAMRDASDASDVADGDEASVGASDGQARGLR